MPSITGAPRKTVFRLCVVSAPEMGKQASRLQGSVLAGLLAVMCKTEENATLSTTALLALEC